MKAAPKPDQWSLLTKNLRSITQNMIKPRKNYILERGSLLGSKDFCPVKNLLRKIYRRFHDV